jgi:hypothetical protein
MPPATYIFEFGITSSTVAAREPVSGVHASSSLPDQVTSRAGPFSSISQAYYWKHTWQAGEHESLADLAAGRARTFVDPSAAVRYLLSTDDND